MSMAAAARRPRRAAPGRPPENKASYSFSGLVPAPIGNAQPLAVQARVPYPQNFRKILHAFRTMNAFQITVVFDPLGIHLCSTTFPPPHVDGDTPRIRVTIPTDAVCSLYICPHAAAGVACTVPIQDLLAFAEPIAASQELIVFELPLPPDADIARRALPPGDSRFPPFHDPEAYLFPDYLRLSTDNGADTCSVEIAAFDFAQFPRLPREPENFPEFTCSWSVSPSQLAAFQKSFASLHINTIVRFSCQSSAQITYAIIPRNRNSGATTYTLDGPSHNCAFPQWAAIRPSKKKAAAPPALRTHYLCEPFSAVASSLTKDHSLLVFMSNSGPCIVVGLPADPPKSSLLQSIRFILEIPTHSPEEPG